jgi:hypothetical protein
MHKLVLIAALGLGLAACNNASDDADTATDEAAAPAATESAAMASANGSAPGLYEVTAADGTVTQTELMADGTYMDHGPDGAVTAQGKWSVADGKTCFDPEGEDAATCYTETAPDAEGKFTATSDAGEAVTVRKAD